MPSPGEMLPATPVFDSSSRGTIGKTACSGSASGAKRVSKVTGVPRTVSKVNDLNQEVGWAPPASWNSVSTTLRVRAEASDSESTSSSKG